MLNIINTEKNQFTFSDGRFYQAESGGWVPSVTTILEAYPKPFALLQWFKEKGAAADEIRDLAGKRGSNVHHLTEEFDRGRECHLLDASGRPAYSLDEWGMFERYTEFVNRYNPEPLLIEQNVVNEKLGYAGTIDRVIDLNGKRLIMDIKTSNIIGNSYWLQLAAYRELLFANSLMAVVDGVAIMWLNAKTRTEGKGDAIQGKGWQLLVKTKDEIDADYDLFKCVHQLWLKENADSKPRLLTYQLMHKK